MLSHQSFEKRGKVAVTKSDLGPRGDVEEFDLVDSGSHSRVTAAPLTTAVDRQSKPAVKVVGDAGANAQVVKLHTKLLASAMPYTSVAPVVIVAV